VWGISQVAAEPVAKDFEGQAKNFGQIKNLRLRKDSGLTKGHTTAIK
jgi:hypothetical protein